MGNYLKMIDVQRIKALLDLGWSYRRIQRETGVRRETIARYDSRGDPNVATVPAGSLAFRKFAFVIGCILRPPISPNTHNHDKLDVTER